MSVAGPSRINIDDTDSRISYSGSWTAGIGTGGLEFNNTSHISKVAGSTATLEFEGDFVEVYGSVRKRNNPVGTSSPISSYTLEDGSSVIFTPIETDSNHFRILFFEKRGLTNSNHTLVVKNLVQGDIYFLDYFVVGSSGDAPSPSPSIGDSTNNALPSVSAPNSITVGTIVGAVIGTMAITLFAVLIGFYCWRRTRGRRKGPGNVDEETNYATQENTQHPGYASTPRLSSLFDRSTNAPATVAPYDVNHADSIHPSQQDPISASAAFGGSGKASRMTGSSLPYLILHRNQGESPPLLTMNSEFFVQRNSDLSYDAGLPHQPPPYARRY